MKYIAYYNYSQTDYLFYFSATKNAKGSSKAAKAKSEYEGKSEHPN